MYGARTAQAVREYQRSRDLLADGIVGEQTWYTLYGDFTGIERDLRNDNINFPQGSEAQAMGQSGSPSSATGVPAVTASSRDRTLSLDTVMRKE